jgi:hypothetical protein
MGTNMSSEVHGSDESTAGKNAGEDANEMEAKATTDGASGCAEVSVMPVKEGAIESSDRGTLAKDTALHALPTGGYEDNIPTSEVGEKYLAERPSQNTIPDASEKATASAHSDKEKASESVDNPISSSSSEAKTAEITIDSKNANIQISFETKIKSPSGASPQSNSRSLVEKGAKESGTETVDAPSEGQRSQMVDRMRQDNSSNSSLNSSISAESDEMKQDDSPRQSLSAETGEGAYLDD